MSAPSPIESPLFPLERAFRAPPEVLSRAWTDPVQLARWWGPAPAPEVERSIEATDAGSWLRVTPRPGGEAAVGGREDWKRRFDRLDIVLAGAFLPDDTLVLSREVAAPRARVWAAWTDPVALDTWWGPDGFVTTTRSFLFEVGGAWLFDMVHPIHGAYPNRVRYTEILTPERITFDHDDGEDTHGHKSVIWFEALPGDRTRVTMMMRLPSAAARAHVEGFGAVELGHQTLAKLAAAVEG